MNEHTQHNLRNKETKRDIDVNDPQIGIAGITVRITGSRST